MIGFALLTIYMLFAAGESRPPTQAPRSYHHLVFLAVKGIQSVESNGVTVDSVFGDKIFRNIVLSLAATYGLYIVASLLALEPWHMSECELRCRQGPGAHYIPLVTSFLQYLLVRSSLPWTNAYC